MGRYDAGLINVSQRYRTQSQAQAKGVYSLQEHFLHKGNANWPGLVNAWPNNQGTRIPVDIIHVAAGTADNTDDYTVSHFDFDGAYTKFATGRVYIAVKVTASTT